MSDLEKCPFCGGEAALEGGKVGCRICSVWIHCDEPDFGIDDVVAQWNHRVAVTDLEFAYAVHDGRVWKCIQEDVCISDAMSLDSCDISKMMHCIGMDEVHMGLRNGKSFYNPFRNYYHASPADIGRWHNLVNQGIAVRNDSDHHIFHLTTKGMRTLSRVIGIPIMEGAAYGNQDAQ